MKGGVFSKLVEAETKLRQVFVRFQVLADQLSAEGACPAIAAELRGASEQLQEVIEHTRSIETRVREALQQPLLEPTP